MLKITHNAGFFSCCTVKLDKIIAYFNNTRQIPQHVDSSSQFEWYKNDTTDDITYDFFKHYDDVDQEINFIKTIYFNHGCQFWNYKTINYDNFTPFIRKYFSPSTEITGIISMIEQKYGIDDYKNICVLFYRGNDKKRETKLCSYEEYIERAKDILDENPNIIFLVQSDETEFIERMLNEFPGNTVYFKDEIRHMNKCNDTVDKVMKNQNYEFSKYYLAITMIMAKCKHIIFGSGNCSIWILFYREHCENVHQNLNGQWI